MPQFCRNTLGLSCRDVATQRAAKWPGVMIALCLVTATCSRDSSHASVATAASVDALSQQLIERFGSEDAALDPVFLTLNAGSSRN